MVMKAHRHPSAVVLEWYSLVDKDEDGYAPLSLLLECLENKCGIKSRVFLQRISSEEWQDAYGWHLQFHPWKPNRVKLAHYDCNQESKKRMQNRGDGFLHRRANKLGNLLKKRLTGRLEVLVSSAASPLNGSACETPEKGTGRFTISQNATKQQKLGHPSSSRELPQFFGWIAKEPEEYG